MIRIQAASMRLGSSGRSGPIEFSLPEFEVAEGEAVALTGPSGCGKSSLLNLVAGLRRADSGEVWVGGVELGGLSAAALDRHRGSLCGMVHQTFHLLAPFSALENVLIGLQFGARRRGDLRARATEALRRVGLGDRLRARPHELSVGERQRVAIARAVAGDPPLLLADEPTGSLDPDTGREIYTLLREVSAEGRRTLLMVTHDHAFASDFPRAVDCSGLVSAGGAVSGRGGGAR